MRKAAVIFIFVTIALDILALGMIIPVLPRLVMEFIGHDTAAAARIYGLFGTLWAIMQFIFSPLLGALSDRVGRRPVVLVSNLGLGLDYLLIGWAPTLEWLFVARIISGITSASIGAASAYIADVTPPDKRAGAFGMLGAAFGLGFVIGPALGGMLGSINLRLPFWVAAALSLINFAYGLFVLPESLPKAHRAKRFPWASANPVGAFRLLRAYPQLSGLAFVHFLSYLAHGVLPAVFVLYAGYRYQWGEREVGMTLAVVGICSAVVQALLVRRVVPLLGERRALLVGLCLGALGMLIYGMAPQGWTFLLGVPVMALWGLATPSLQGMMTRRVAPNEQGQLQGANSSISSIAQLFSPILFTHVFSRAIATDAGVQLPGAPFLLAAMLIAAAALYSWSASAGELPSSASSSS